MADWLESVCGFHLQDTERELVQLRYARLTGFKITFEEFADQVAPVIKNEQEVEEERDDQDDQEEVDPDAVGRDEYEEEFNRNNIIDDRQRDLVSANEDEESDVDGQMRGRRYSQEEPRDNLPGGRQEYQPEDEVPREDEYSEEDGNGSDIKYLG